MLRVSLVRSYRSQNGNVTFVYVVKGSKEELQRYKELQGDFYRQDDEGNALWFTTHCIGERGKLKITINDNVVPDMSEFDQASSLSEQYGGNFGQELARISAQRILGKMSADDDDGDES